MEDMKKIKPKDLLGEYKLKIDIKNSVPACMMCLPPVPLKDHKSLYGILVHSRVDCPPGMLYMVNEKDFARKIKISWSCGVKPFCEHKTKLEAKVHQLFR